MLGQQVKEERHHALIDRLFCAASLRALGERLPLGMEAHAGSTLWLHDRPAGPEWRMPVTMDDPYTKLGTAFVGSIAVGNRGKITGNQIGLPDRLREYAYYRQENATEAGDALLVNDLLDAARQLDRTGLPNRILSDLPQLRKRRLMKITTKIAAIYFAFGILTLLHWEFVWLKGAPAYGAWNRTSVTVVFGPCIAATWPAYWVTMYRLGTWAWLPTLALSSQQGESP